MFLTIDIRQGHAIHQQIADGIRTLIAGGQLGVGEPLPPLRQLAADLGVNMNTIAAAYRQLQSDGLINMKHGSRATVASRTVAKQSDDELRRPLRNALTQMILAGLKGPEILSTVNDELSSLLTGVKS